MMFTSSDSIEIFRNVTLRAALRQYQLHKLRLFAMKPRLLSYNQNDAPSTKEAYSLLAFLQHPHSAVEISKHFGWQIEATYRLLQVLWKNQILTKENNSQNQELFISQKNQLSLALSQNAWELLLWEVLDRNQPMEDLQQNSAFSEIFGQDFYQNPELSTIFRYHYHVVSRFFQDHCIETSLQENRACPDIALGLPGEQIFDFYRMDPELLAIYSQGFSAGTSLSNDFFISKLPFQKDLTVLDIGGGSGELASQIGAQRPDYQSICVYDLPQAAQALSSLREKSIQKSPVSLEWLSGDMFEEGQGFAGCEVDRKFDIMIMGWILHDWDDEKNKKILQKAQQHLAKDGTLYVLEKVKTEENSDSLALVDFCMLLMANGYERSLSQYKDLLERSGFELTQFIPCAVGRDILVAKATR